MSLPPELGNLLDRCIEEPQLRPSLESEIWRRFGRQLCIIATDLEGFTACTHKAGTVHALALLQIQLALARPVVECHAGRLIKVEGDSLFLAFPTALSAVSAALDLRERVAEHSRLNPGFRLGICQGIACGWVIDLGNDLYGAPMNVASKLGEDMATSGQILVTAEVADAVRSGLDLPGEPRLLNIGGEDLPCWLVLG